MVRKGKYDQFRFNIIEFLYTRTDGGVCLRAQLVREFNLPKGSASDVIKRMAKDGIIKTSRWFNKSQRVKLTDKGRQEYESKYQKQEYQIPLNVRRYLAKRGIANQLFPIQNNFVNRGLIYAKKNVCVFGYPGAGKTLVAEMAMVNELTEGGKILYCTPYKALDRQKFNDFKSSFDIIFPKLQTVVVDSDNPISSEELSKARIVIATYERVLGAMRNSQAWLKHITLVCADEITHLADEERGSTLDIVLTFLKNMQQKPRIITISSLVGNTREIAKWLDAETIIENRPAALDIPIEENIVFKDDDHIKSLSKDGKEESWKIDGDIVEAVTKKNLDANQTTLIFTGYRRATEDMARNLQTLHPLQSQLAQKAKEFLETKVREQTTQAMNACNMIGYGIAYHHAGLQKSIRQFIEDLLHKNELKTVVATTTLSHGVDYKIDSVVIDIEPLIRIKRGIPVYEYINLKGRAGRPGNSKNANIYIVTNKSNPEKVFMKYFHESPESLIPTSPLDPASLESIILSESTPNLDMKRIVEFLKKTFRYQTNPRMLLNTLGVVRILLKYGFLKKSGKDIRITELGQKTNEANLSANDAIQIMSLKPNTDPESILELASRIDLAKKFNKNIKFNRVKALQDRMNGTSIDGLRKKFGEFHDQDLIDLVSYTSFALKKMAVIIEDKNLKKKILRLREKLNKK